MKKILFIILISFSSIFAQSNTQDTLIVKSKKLKIIKSNWGAKLNIGISKYNYGTKTKKWLGNHYGPTFNLTLLYKNFRFGFGFKPWTVNPKEELSFNGNTLTTFAKLNPIKLELTLGYNFFLFSNINIESYLGYSNNSFHVINEDVIGKKYKITSTNGYTFGLNLYKDLFRFNPYDNMQVYLNFNYNFVDFSKVNSQLDKNFYGFIFGLSFQGWFTSVEVLD